MLVGMITQSKDGLVAIHDGKPALFHEYEILCAGKGASFKWVEVTGRFKPGDIKDVRPLQYGTEKSGEALYVAKTTIHGREYVGKVSTKSKVMRFPHKGSEDKAKSYFVLCED
ncbi:hypothetical protein LPJ61_006348 [Coemansia biformis]|uniref:Uncharacterized protein n=1 Tax=Coemansia biformis TaxID=1286918 RepID=A0A9W7XRC0_9FUNG|nr:hypothetical protein LPJ61_006348 [Coemansia biformis]